MNPSLLTPWKVVGTKERPVIRCGENEVRVLRSAYPKIPAKDVSAIFELAASAPELATRLRKMIAGFDRRRVGADRLAEIEDTEKFLTELGA